MSTAATIPNPQVPLAAVLSYVAYTDNPDQKDPNDPSLYNIQTAVAAMHTSYYPLCQVVWSSQLTDDDNYAYVAETPDNQYFLVIRGSLPFEVDGSVVIDWGVIANWFAEDFDVFSQVSWPYAAGDAYVASGTMTAFSNLLTAQDIMGSKLSLYNFLKNNAVKKGHPVYITGHSLGGNIANAYASYFAHQLKADKLSNSGNFLYTFAAPAAGNQAFADDLDNKFPVAQSFHYEIDNDIIPKFPVLSSIIEVSTMFNPHPQAANIGIKVDGIRVTLQYTIDTMGFAIDASVTSSYAAQGTITTMPYSLDGANMSDTFTDWFDQAAYQHSCVHYIFMFIIDADTNNLVAKLATRMTKAKSAHLQ